MPRFLNTWYLYDMVPSSNTRFGNKYSTGWAQPCRLFRAFSPILPSTTFLLRPVPWNSWVVLYVAVYCSLCTWSYPILTSTDMIRIFILLLIPRPCIRHPGICSQPYHIQVLKWTHTDHTYLFSTIPPLKHTKYWAWQPIFNLFRFSGLFISIYCMIHTVYSKIRLNETITAI